MTARILASLIAYLVAAAGAVPSPGSGGPNVADNRVNSAGSVYAAVVRQLVTKDTGFGGEHSPYRHVYVLNGVVSDAADPMHLTDRPQAPFGNAVAQRISAQLRDLPSVSFVRSRQLVVVGQGAGHVVGRGVLITLGRIEWTNSETAEVASDRWSSGLNGQWLTYTLRYQDSTWHVVGVVGGTAVIS